MRMAPNRITEQQNVYQMNNQHTQTHTNPRHSVKQQVAIEYVLQLQVERLLFADCTHNNNNNNFYVVSFAIGQ